MITKTIDISGAVVYWRPGPADADRLKAGLKAIGREGLMPSDRTPKAVLHSALIGLYAQSDRLVRPIKKRSAFSVVTETRRDHGNDYENAILVEVSDDGDIDVNVKGGDFSWYEEHKKIEAAYKEAAAVVPSQSVTRVLTTALGNLNGIALRPAGAVYWVPKDAIDAWHDIAEVMEAAAITKGDIAVYALKTTNDESALRAIKDGIADEVKRVTDAIMGDLMSGELGVRALESRKEEAIALAKRLKEYEAIIGETLTDIREQIEATETSAAEAVMLASAILAGNVT